MYLDEAHALQKRHKALLVSMQSPASCSSGCRWEVKEGGWLQCIRCLRIPFGTLAKPEELS